MRIAIIGYSGSGKSTLASRLGEKYGVEVLYLDKVHWLPGWTERDRREELSITQEFLDKNSSWVIDGNYSKSFYERRMEEADSIIFMNFNRFSCLKRILKRFKNNKGKTRDSMTEGCNEKIDAEFLKWILWDGRTKKHKNRFKDTVNRYKDKVTVIRNGRELTKYYNEHGLKY